MGDTVETGPPFSTTLSPSALAEYVARQINIFFPDHDESGAVGTVMGDALERMEHCARHVRSKTWWDDNGPRFSHRHTDQYAVFLYFLANTAYRRGEKSVAVKAYALNRALHGVDAFYSVELPAIFTLVHPMGTVLGRANYSDYFCAYHNVTIGMDADGSYPTFGTGVVMYDGSRAVGGAHVGDNCILVAGCSLQSDRVPDNHVAIGRHPAVQVKPTKRSVVADVFANM